MTAPARSVPIFSASSFSDVPLSPARSPISARNATLLVDQITCADALERLALAKARGVKIFASASINHLSFNELDIGDYRTFAKLDPPLRCEDDRQALIEAVASGLVDIVVSAHDPEPAESKRLPFDEAAPARRASAAVSEEAATLSTEVTSRTPAPVRIRVPTRTRGRSTRLAMIVANS